MFTFKMREETELKRPGEALDFFEYITFYKFVIGIV